MRLIKETEIYRVWKMDNGYTITIMKFPDEIKIIQDENIN